MRLWIVETLPPGGKGLNQKQKPTMTKLAANLLPILFMEYKEVSKTVCRVELEKIKRDIADGSADASMEQRRIEALKEILEMCKF